MVSVFTIESEARSAEKLGFPTETYRYPVFKPDNIVIRWGNSSLYYSADSTSYDYEKVINPSAAITLNCEKNLALQRLATVVKTPQIFNEKVPANRYAVVRPVCHTGGSGFNVKLGPCKIPYDYYATQYIKTDKEIRVWFCGDRTMCARRVTVTNAKNDEFPCRSNWGYSFWEKVPGRLHADTLMGANAIGLDFGAADILYKDGEYYFLEYNSAATLDNKRLVAFYKEGLVRLIKKKFGIAV